MAATFSAALLAGGKSRRMGRDKALLPAAGAAFLWQRQLALLEELAPQRLFWSGFAREGLPPHITLVADPVTESGPLAGICGCLEALESELLLVLAVDLAHMSAPFLRRLLLACTSGRGTVPRRDGRFEPLAAVYPKAMLAPARERLGRRQLILQEFVATGVEAGLLQSFELAAEDLPLFLNLNRAEDLEPPSG